LQQLSPPVDLSQDDKVATREAVKLSSSITRVLILTDDSFVLFMRFYPEPDYFIPFENANGSMSPTDAG
jgi:hypothetical protein